MIGAENISGPIFSQACATGTTEIAHAGIGVETGLYSAIIAITVDRCSNGPLLIYPNPDGPGARPISEDWLMDNFKNDPWARNSMLQTAENVAAAGNHQGGMRRTDS